MFLCSSVPNPLSFHSEEHWVYVDKDSDTVTVTLKANSDGSRSKVLVTRDCSVPCQDAVSPEDAWMGCGI